MQLTRSKKRDYILGTFLNNQFRKLKLPTEMNTNISPSSHPSANPLLTQ